MCMPLVSQSCLSHSLGCACFLGCIQNQFLQTGMGKPECKHFFLVCCPHLHRLSSIRTSIYHIYWAMHSKKECRPRNWLTSDDTNNVHRRSRSVYLLHSGYVASLGIPDPSLHVDCFLRRHFQHDVPSLRQPWQFTFLGGHHSDWLYFAHFAARGNLVMC